MDKSSQPTIEDWMDIDEKSFREHVHQIMTKLPEYTDINDYHFQYYFSSGISSLVGVVNLDGERLIFKTSRWHLNVLREVSFLNLWREQGVSTPEIHQLIEIDTAKFGTVRIAFMEYFNSKTAFHILEQEAHDKHTETWNRIGEITAATHTISATGLGKPIEPDFRTGKHLTFSDYVGQNLLTPGNLKTLRNAGYKIDEVDNWVADLLAADLPSLVTHHDLGLHNVLGVDNKLVLIDPDPTIDYSYIDLATSYIWATIQSGKENANTMIESYRSHLSARQQIFDHEIFDRALNLRLYSKHARWLERLNSHTSKSCLSKTIELLP